ncbi:MAG: GNAT family N-acetyltransferase, partial [Aestuariivirgaceae bacterium]
RKLLLAEGALAACEKLQASSIHITFVPEADWTLLGQHGWLRRTDTQFHWHNQGFATFDDFTCALSSRKRKNIMRERRHAHSHGLKIERLTGADLKEEHWDAFFGFYLDTGSRKWGTPYLTRAFFSMIGEALADHIMLVMVSRGGRYLAGALNLIGGDTLFGRNWGATGHFDCLHFEACYYQAIEFAIERKLSVIEAGAQGPHKLARGYLPATTHSLHYLADPRLARAVEDYLEYERDAVATDGRLLGAHSPFRDAAPGEN